MGRGWKKCEANDRKNLDQLEETVGRNANTEGAPGEEEVRGMAEKAVIIENTHIIMDGMGGKT